MLHLFKFRAYKYFNLLTYEKYLPVKDRTQKICFEVSE